MILLIHWYIYDGCICITILYCSVEITSVGSIEITTDGQPCGQANPHHCSEDSAMALSARKHSTQEYHASQWTVDRTKDRQRQLKK